MSAAENTVFLRLAGPMQSWGTSSRLQLRRTDAYPSKSGVLGMILCAMGIRREDSQGVLKPLAELKMGVRVDRKGTLDWDYHTAGAQIGIRKAEGGIKHMGNKKDAPFETLLSRRQYLFDASFLVALQGETATVAGVIAALVDVPGWPVYLGRKCCVPSEPVFAGVGSFSALTDALASLPWRPRHAAVDHPGRIATRTLDVYLEHPPDSPPPPAARLVHDVPWFFGFNNHHSRFVVAAQVTVPVGEALQQPVKGPYRRPFDYNSDAWHRARRARLELDHGLCVFCKSPAEEVHHVDYPEVDTNENLRSLCGNCHDACTMLEYARDLGSQRVDPSDPKWRAEILRQIDRLLSQRRMGRRRELLTAARRTAMSFLDDAPGLLPEETY